MSTPDLPSASAPFDPAMIARMANELFAAFPGTPDLPPGAGIASAPPATPPVEVGALPGAAAIPPSPAVKPLTEVELRSLPATLSGATLRPPQAGFTPSAWLGPYDFRPELVPDEGTMSRPGAPVATPPPVTPPVEMGTPSAASATGLTTPSEAELRALPATLAVAPATPYPAPPPPGGRAFYYFLDQDPPPATELVLPIDDGFHPDMLPDLGLLAGPYDPRIDRGGFPVR